MYGVCEQIFEELFVYFVYGVSIDIVLLEYQFLEVGKDYLLSFD